MVLEFLFRGWSHGSMFLAGGICFLLIGKLNRVRPQLSLVGKLFFGVLIVTMVELAAGLLVNRNYTVWDYRDQFLNFHGQICLLFSLAWVPVSRLRRFRRGYDQVELIAKEVGVQLGYTPQVILKKVRNTPAQSSLVTAAQRRANVMGVYSIPDAKLVHGKRILLLDDIITTGSTISECAKTLQFAGAKAVYCAAVAAAAPKKN